MKESPPESSLWKKTSVSNLVRYAPSGKYFARVRVGGKLIRQSLKTDAFSVAQLRLGDLVKCLRQTGEQQTKAGAGKMGFGDARVLYEQRLEASRHLKPSVKLYRQKSIAALLKSWPALDKTDVRKLSESDCLAWADSFQRGYPPSFRLSCGAVSAQGEVQPPGHRERGNEGDRMGT